MKKHVVNCKTGVSVDVEMSAAEAAERQAEEAAWLAKQAEEAAKPKPPTLQELVAAEVERQLALRA